MPHELESDRTAAINGPMRTFSIGVKWTQRIWHVASVTSPGLAPMRQECQLSMCAERLNYLRELSHASTPRDVTDEI